jgi:hypothetical protein
MRPAEIGDADLDRLRAYGYRDEQIVEVAGLVSLQLLTGAFQPHCRHTRRRKRSRS